MKERTLYYSDPVNDDFAGNNIKTAELPEDYAYFPKTALRRGFAFVFYHVIASPLVFLIQKIVFEERVVGREKLKDCRKDGFYLYGNHTRAMGDAYCPGILSRPKKAYIVAGADAFSIKGIRRIVQDLGGIALPSGKNGYRNFSRAMMRHSDMGHVITLFPEAHIWPQYTGIRPFRSEPFHYPAETGKPVFTFTTTWHKKKLLPGARTVVYVDGPFIPDMDLPVNERRQRLRDQAFEAMTKRAANSTYEGIKYIYRPKEKEAAP